MPWMPVELPLSIRQTPVLLVDDSASQREYTAELLTDLGLSRVMQTSGGREALALLRHQAERREPPPLLILDLEMPDMDGIELLLRLHEEGIRPPVILASGREEALVATVQDMIRNLPLPLLGSLSKPLSSRNLHDLLHRLPNLASLAPEPAILPVIHVTPRELRDGLRRNHLRPHYQPKIELASGRVLGYEALARWHDPQRGLLHPCEFIAPAAENGLLPELTFQLIDQVLIDAARLRLQGWAPSMAINVDIGMLAGRDFSNDLIRRVRDSGARTDQLILEVTESALMRDAVATLATAGRLRLAGFGLSIDDYGTGFSTLRQLTLLPFTELKIDRAFVAGARHDRRNRTILQSAIDMGARLHLPSIAEGVETVEEVRLLRELGCSAAQGYLFARPIPGEALASWHAAHVGRASLDDWLRPVAHP